MWHFGVVSPPLKLQSLTLSTALHAAANIHNGFNYFVFRCLYFLLSPIVLTSQLSAAAPFLDSSCLHALRNAFAMPFATLCARWVRNFGVVSLGQYPLSQTAKLNMAVKKVSFKMHSHMLANPVRQAWGSRCATD